MPMRPRPFPIGSPKIRNTIRRHRVTCSTGSPDSVSSRITRGHADALRVLHREQCFSVPFGSGSDHERPTRRTGRAAPPGTVPRSAGPPELACVVHQQLARSLRSVTKAKSANTSFSFRVFTHPMPQYKGQRWSPAAYRSWHANQFPTPSSFRHVADAIRRAGTSAQTRYGCCAPDAAVRDHVLVRAEARLLVQPA